MSRETAGASSASRLRRVALPGLAFAALAGFYLKSLGHPSLWLDEAWEANYYLGIVPEPWYNRPVLYMAAVRLVTRALGPGELALRLLPCLAGLATIAATWRLVRRTLGSACGWLAAALLAIAPTFLYESHQLKHYTFDALFTALLLLAYLRYRESPTGRRLTVFALTGLVSFGFSFTSLFVLAAIGIVHVAVIATARRRAGEERDAARPATGASAAVLPPVSTRASGLREFAFFLGANVFLLAAFTVVYRTFHASAQGDTLLKDYFVDAWAPLSDPLALPGWLARQTRVLGEIAGASSFVAFALLLAAGAWREVRQAETSSDGSGSDILVGPQVAATVRPSSSRPASSLRAPLPLLTAVLVAGLVVILLASAGHLYPYGSARLTLFLAPLVAALAAAGMLEVLGVGARSRTWTTGAPWVRGVAGAGLLYVLMYPAISGARPYLARGWGTDELGRNVETLARAHAPGEGIYVPERAASSFVYYWWRSGKGTDHSDVVWGERHRLRPADHGAQIARLAADNPSLWVIFDDQSRAERETLRAFFLERYESVRREGTRDAESIELFRSRSPASGG